MYFRVTTRQIKATRWFLCAYRHCRALHLLQGLPPAAVPRPTFTQVQQWLPELVEIRFVREGETSTAPFIRTVRQQLALRHCSQSMSFQ